ncbi:MAG: hypothetical protein QXY18_02090 [Nitrososphaerota archaeon]
MIKYIKLPSLFIILLLFPISFYFNIISINCNSEDNFPIEDIDIDIYPIDVYKENWRIIIRIFCWKEIINANWSEINRNGSILYANVIIKFGDRIAKSIEEVYSKAFCTGYLYEITNLEEGNYTFILYINGKEYPDSIEHFTVKKEIEIYVVPLAIIYFEEGRWIAKVTLRSNMITKGIHWGDLEKTKYGFKINITVEKWTGTPKEYCAYESEEHIYDLGILPEGEYDFDIYINGEYSIASPTFEVRPITDTIITFDVFTEATYTTSLITETIQTSEVTSTIHASSKTSSIIPTLIIEETKKGEVELWSISLLAFLISFFVSLYIFLKRRKI